MCFFKEGSIRGMSLNEWLDMAAGNHDKFKVVLPMIQRGSVWAPHKILDLWDTLLRGMPIGAMMASEAKLDELIKDPNQDGTRKASAGDINLIDGQQRTLAIRVGYPQNLNNTLRPFCIWVDLTDSPQGEYLFRLWATTKAQPYGYARVNIGGKPLSKLERSKLRLANQIWEKPDASELWKKPDFMPWEARFALPLNELFANIDQLQDFVHKRLISYKNALEAKVIEADGKNDINFKQISEHFTKILKALPDEARFVKSISILQAALKNLSDYQFPVIRVRQETFDDLQGHSEDHKPDENNIDPPLAILFKRVGTGGVELSNADYVYSVIKHHSPQVHDMVESLLKDEKDERICAIYTPTTLVMSAVRLTMLTLDGKGQKIVDSSKLDKATFARLVRSHEGFIDEFEKAIKEDGIFVTCLKQVLDKLSYDKNVFPTGLPKHALSLIPLPLLETILFWYTLRKPSADAMERSRLPMLRFVLQGNLCVTDYAKASEVAIKALKDDKNVLDLAKNNNVDVQLLKGDEFPDQVLMSLLSKGEKATALPLPSPGDLRAIKDKNELSLIVTPDDKGLRGWTRFEANKLNEKSYAEVYKRWWNRRDGHTHPMLLWLQRDYIFSKFEEQPALAGMEEETPFDFDHILPSAHWANWRGERKCNKFIDYPLKIDKIIQDNSGSGYIGNSIGNIHVLESSENRAWGDKSVKSKIERDGFIKNSVISFNGKLEVEEFDRNITTQGGDEFWLEASGDEGKPREWSDKRALAFQRAVEKRVFALYVIFYTALFNS